MWRRTFMASGLTLVACRPGGSSSEVHPPGPPAAATATAPSPTPMITRPLPRTGELLPVIGLGDWSGGVRSDRARSRALLDALMAAGGRLLDIPANGAEVEQAAGDLLADAGAVQRAFLSTRVRVPGHEEGQMQMERTLARLGRRRIDLMQVHALTDFTTHLETLRRWRTIGHARYIGATIDQPGALPALEPEIRGAGLDVVQLPYSIFDRTAEASVLPAAAEHGVAVIVMRPFGDAATLGSLQQRPLPPLAAALECTSWEQLLLKWILAHPAVHCVLPDTKHLFGAADLLHAGSGPLPDERQRRELVALLERG